MFESVGCGERQLPAHHSDLVQNRLVYGATFQLESDLRSYNFLVCQGGLGQVNRLASEQRLLTLPAVGRAGKLIRTHAVGGLAMGADDVQGFAHMS